ncbi:MAG: OmpA family protein [Paludibacteraceae bacterium]|nr:OmpA family protein [Paludibacteraceae bacterium]
MVRCNKIVLLICALLLTMSATAAQQKKGPVTYTKKYQNTRLEVVLQDVAEKWGYTLNYDKADIDIDKRITAQFKDASLKKVMTTVLDKDLSYKVKKRVLSITRKPQKPVEQLISATSPSDSIVTDTLITRVFQDTLLQITDRYITRDLPAVVDTTRKPAVHHYLIASLGAGYGSWGYKLEQGNNLGGVASQARLQYAYMFNEHWGLSVGLGVSEYMSTGRLNGTFSWQGQTDTDGEKYNHNVVTDNWKENQVSLMVDVPVEALYVHKLNDKLSIMAGLGAQIGMPVYNTYRLKSGEINHTGYYEPWHLTLPTGAAADFYTESIGTDFDSKSQKASLRMPAAKVMADLGFLIPMSDEIDLLTGVWFNYTVNNIQQKDLSQIGWRQDGYSDYRSHDFMPQYAGLTQTTEANAIRPWAVGINIGIRWHKRPKDPDPVPQYERLLVKDTVRILQAREEKQVIERKQVIKQIQKLMERSVIFFDLDSDVPKLEPADILDRIAVILIQNPAQKIIIAGHASKEGGAEYNQRLSERRAEAVMKQLIEKGVPQEQMKAESYGDTQEYHTGAKVHNISLDRRVEIIPQE